MKGGEEEGGVLFSGHKNICNEQKEGGGNGSGGAAIKGMVLVGNWIGRQKGAINCINVPFYWGKDSVQLGRSGSKHVRPDWICMRVVPLESPLKGH